MHLQTQLQYYACSDKRSVNTVHPLFSEFGTFPQSDVVLYIQTFVYRIVHCLRWEKKMESSELVYRASIGDFDT